MELKKRGKENQKKAVAKKASQTIKDDMTLGLGTGSTVAYFIKEISKKDLEINAICSSLQTKKRAIEADIPLTSFEEIDKLDLTVDGADQVDNELNLIKGGGAAHFREKILAKYSEEFICIVDETKETETLDNPVPIEIPEYSFSPVQKYLEKKAEKTKLRNAKEKDGPIITDNGNLILDAYFGEIKKPKKLNKELNNLTGILEHGLFTDMVNKVYLGKPDTVKIINKGND